jgi:hypothetical protein
MDEYMDNGDFRSPNVDNPRGRAAAAVDGSVVNLDNWPRIFVGLSNLIPVSNVVHMQ